MPYQRMRRDYFTLDVADVDWVERDDDPAKPTLHLSYEGPVEDMRAAFETADDTRVESDNIDVGFRFQAPVDAEDATGVISIAHRLTGEFLLEVNADADDVRRFIRAARSYGEAVPDDTDLYAVVIDHEAGEMDFEKRTFLVYNRDGRLLRQYSLIPSGVEL